jgi:hypothetical protein
MDKELLDLIKESKGGSESASEDSCEAVEELGSGATEELERSSDTDKEVSVVYRKWIMGLVEHLASIRVLEQVSRKLKPKANISIALIGLDRPSLKSEGWDAMETIIRKLCQDKSLVSKVSKMPLPPDFPDKVIGILRSEVNNYQRPGSSIHKTSMRFEASVYAFFQNLLADNPDIKKLDFQGCNHCEAILMAVIYRIIHKNDLDFSLKACSP